jgi:amino acid transporter
MVPLFCFTFLPFLNGDFTTDNLTYKLDDPSYAWGGLQMALVWIWVMIWSTAPEAAATFAPEYKDTGRDTRKALISSAVFITFINTVVPISLTGGVGPKTVEGIRLRRSPRPARAARA